MDVADQWRTYVMAEYSADTLTRALAAAAEAFLAALPEAAAEGFGPIARVDDVTWAPATGEPILFDPLTDPLPMEATPDRQADRKFQDMCTLVYLGSIGRFYAETGEGADAGEIRRFALKAGYANGRAVNGWNSRPGSRGAVEVVEGRRFINRSAADWLQRLQRDLGIKINGEYKWVNVDDDGHVTFP